MSPRTIWVGVLVAAIFLDRPAGAQPAPPTRLVYVRYVGAADCPGEEDIRAMVARRLGHDPFQAGKSELDRGSVTLIATIRRFKGGLHGRVELTDQTGRSIGTRELTSWKEDCQELASAMEMAISIAIDPLGAQSAVAGEPDALPSPPTPTPLPPDVSSVEARAPVRRERSTHLRASVGALLPLGVPTSTLGLTLQLGLLRTWWSLNLEARGDLPATDPVAGGQVTIAMLLISLMPCFHKGIVSACLLGSVGPQWASGSGYLISRSAVVVHAAVGVRAGVEVPFWRTLFLRVHVDLLVPVTRTELLVNTAVIYQTQPVNGAFGIALGGTFL